VSLRPCFTSESPKGLLLTYCTVGESIVITSVISTATNVPNKCAGSGNGNNRQAVSFCSVRRGRRPHKSLTIAPNSSTAWGTLGYTYHYLGLTGLAEVAWRRRRDLGPSLPQPYWMHSRMLFYQGKAQEAEAEVRRALQRVMSEVEGYWKHYVERFGKS
jgi:hypothetical protein